MISAIHQSMLGTALRCQEQFRRRYIEEEKIPPGIAVGIGTSVHRVNETNLSQKIYTGTDMPLEDLHDVARDSFFATFEDGVYLPREMLSAKNTVLNDSLNSTINLTTSYHKHLAPQIINPIGIEQNFAIDIGAELPLAGRIDYIQQDGTLFDIKTSKKSWAANDGATKYWMQAAFYMLARRIETGVSPPGFVYHVIVNLKTKDKIQTELLQLTANYYVRLRLLIDSFCQMLGTGVFLPADPSHWICDERWCGYFLTCKFVGN